MPNKRTHYPPEFRQRMIELVRSGRNPEALAREFEPSAQAIRNWVAQADRDNDQCIDDLTSGERFRNAASFFTARIYSRCVSGTKLRTRMSSIMRARSGVTGRSWCDRLVGEVPAGVSVIGAVLGLG